MSDKKNVNKCTARIFVSMTLAPIITGLGCVLYSNIRESDYVIASKGANKIEYYSIKNPADTHIMTFDGDTALSHGGWYPYLSVGDTISGPAILMDKPFAKSTHYQGMRYPILKTTIKNKNGKTLREMRQNQK